MTLRASLEQASMAVERILLMRSSTQFGTGISSGVEPSGLSRMTGNPEVSGGSNIGPP